MEVRGPRRGLHRARHAFHGRARNIAELVRLDGKLDLTCRHLTLPDQKALEIGKAMATQPQMILLDEVMAGLRPAETQEVVRMIQNLRERGVTFLVVEHNMDVIMSLSDRIVVMGTGRKIIEGAPATVNEDAQGKGWFMKLKLDNRGDADELMDEAAYKEFLATLA